MASTPIFQKYLSRSLDTSYYFRLQKLWYIKDVENLILVTKVLNSDEIKNDLSNAHFLNFDYIHFKKAFASGLSLKGLLEAILVEFCVHIFVRSDKVEKIQRIENLS